MVCHGSREFWGLSRATVYRRRLEAPDDAPRRRPGPIGACPDAELADHIRRLIEESGFHGEGYRKLWARLRVAGVRASLRRVRRVMGEHGLLVAHCAAQTRMKIHDGAIITDRINEMWGTDMTQTVTTDEGKAYVFVAVEHANSEIVGISCRKIGELFRGAGACSASGNPLLWLHHPERRPRIETAPRSRVQLHVHGFSSRNQMPRN